ncbi:mitochondrial ribosomal subunit protein-domain-containing protein [Boeremia exigua]|uniref:mitochondrial ribosomal subunit protein-domain-containing protein n=1 Tax=Boeremia exigua TaxID=749465 RepID=UPI001E8D9064|nr:mitochondrial ribosomal subunit protein-domain-containing protein [Boeremia exigua]KAH6633042.1 mitochondrial ribosomal subunit protein-domain-containing protein [Boeremia exigua]
MASVTRRLLLQSRRCPSSTAPRSTPKCVSQWQRPFSTTPGRSARNREDEPPQAPAKPAKPVTHTPEETTAQLRKLAEDFRQMDPAIAKDAARKGKDGWPLASEFNLETEEDFQMTRDEARAVKQGFWAEGEESMGADEDYYGDDLTRDGHAQLRSHRHLRAYARLIAWEMPLLHQLARPFEPPTAATPFRFRYTSYLGESHPAANKVVVEFSPSDLGLTELQRAKLIKLSGPRYNPSSDLVKLSAEQFDSQTQNKRFVGETIQSLIAEAKDATDTFEDVPFDFRHHKPKTRHQFPKEWILTEERKHYLAAKRAETARLQDEKVGNGLLIDGQTIVDTSLPFAEQAEPVLVAAPRRK